eukprot:1018743-Pelagomonas_calceolata.AAC.1
MASCHGRFILLGAEAGLPALQSEKLPWQLHTFGRGGRPTWPAEWRGKDQDVVCLVKVSRWQRMAYGHCSLTQLGVEAG